MLLRLQKQSNKSSHNEIDEDAIFEGLQKAAQTIKYFGGLLEDGDEIFEEVKKQLKIEFDKYIEGLSKQIAGKALNMPHQW
jgi:hypothetical protein